MTLNRIAKLVSLFLLFTVPLASNAIGISYSRNFPDQPTVNSKIWSITSDELSNWMFMTTNEYLASYDGNQWKTYPLNNGSEVRSVNFSEEHDRIYVGGINEFGFFYPGQNGELDYVCLSDCLDDRRMIGNIWGIYPTGRRLILQGDNCILVYELNDVHNSKVIYCGCKIDCSSMIDGSLFLGTEQGLKKFDGSKIVDVESTRLIKGKRIRGIEESGQGLLLITANDGVFSYGYGVMSETSLKEKYHGEIFCSAISDRYLALGTINRGVFIINRESGEVENYNESNGLLSNTILSLCFDKKNNLWIGHDGGVEQLYLDLPLKTLSNSKLSIGLGYVSIIYDNKLWVGTNRGLYSLDLPINYPLEFHSIRGVTGQVWGLKEINGRLMLCHDHGLFEIGNDGRAKRIEGLNGVWDIQKLTSDGSCFLIGAYDGIYTLDFDEMGFKNFNKIDGYDGSPYNFVHEGDTVIWMCEGTEGISRLMIDPINKSVKSHKRYLLTTNNVPLTQNVLINRVGNETYILTRSGIFSYDHNLDVISENIEINSILGNRHSCIEIKKFGDNLFALSSHELIRYELSSGNRVIIPLLSDWSVPRPYGDIIDIVDESTVIMPSMTGYTFADFDSETFTSADLSLDPGKINSLTVTSNGDASVFNSNFMGVRNQIVLRPDDNSIKISFGNDFLSRNKIVNYQYRLDNEPMSEPSFSTVKEYTNLSDGKHTFYLLTNKVDGTTSEDSIDFTIQPFWYKTNIAKTGYLLLIVAIILFGSYLLRRRFERQNAKLILQKDKELQRQQELYEHEEKLKNEKIELLEKEKLQLELNRKTQELTNLLVGEANKNEILSSIKQELQSIYRSSGLSTEARKSIKSLQSRIDVGMDTGEILKRAGEEFDLLYNDFTKNLRLTYPDLSNNDIMLCSYLKMNLSTKEIAPLMNVSTRGLETMRYRLRKKLGLDRDESLSGFLANFSN
ncbi:MAG: hypothetical protein J1E99_07645 [Muribaculaceae bacterium]|nr:hypothetical protein [Muribaculaceae bacterium]